MMSAILNSISETSSYPEFSELYQDYVKGIQDDILNNEFNINKHKMKQLKSFNCLLAQLNVLTEELQTL